MKILRAPCVAGLALFPIASVAASECRVVIVGYCNEVFAVVLAPQQASIWSAAIYRRFPQRPKGFVKRLLG